VMDASGVVLAELDSVEAEELLRAGTVSGGMIPKVRAGLRAASASVRTSIVDGREAGALTSLFEGTTSASAGTSIR
ncbi:MAG: acetylglutamate kinase, partial [Chloroflexi bacterium]|nr:acetylglutamate kinase [Chloroflexota bacterium]